MNTVPRLNVTPGRIYTDCGQLLYRHAPKFSDRYKVLVEVVSQLEGDLHAYANRDPSCHGDIRLVYETITGYQANMYYRVAHALLNSGSVGAIEKQEIEIAARKITEVGKIKSWVEINPHAEIGERFTLDHGCFSIIGETAKIGNDVSFLSGVVLGAVGVANNPVGKRHPTIEDGVQIGVNSKVLGPITVGKGSFIGADCVVTESLLPYSRVVLKCKQIVTRQNLN